MERITRAAAVLGIRVPRTLARRFRYILTVALAATMLPAGSALAVNSLTSASVTLSDPQPSATSVDYSFKASSVTSGNIQCVKAVFSTTATGDTAPAGWSGASGSISAASSTLVNSTATNWSLATSDGTSSSGQKNVWKYTNSAGGDTPGTLTGATFVLSGITNSSTANAAFFLQISTYNNTNCSSSPVDAGVTQFIDTTGSTLSLTINPTLSFSVAGVSSGGSCPGGTATGTSDATNLPFGSVTIGANSFVCQDLQASTNATNGYTIFTRYSAKPTSGSNTIADLGGGSPVPNSAPTTFTSAGTESYGYTTNDQTLSTCGGSCSANRFFNGTTYSWAAMSPTNAEIAYEPTGVSTATYRIGHQVGVATTTPAGTYTTTIIYTCTPVY